MVLDYFIINIHMQLRRRGDLVIILSIPIAYTRFTKKLKREEADHTLLTQGKEEGGTRAVLQRHTHICIDINTQKEGNSSSILSNSYSFVNLQYVFGFSPNSYVEPYVWLISFTTQSTMNLFVTQYFISHYLVMVNLIQFI